MKKVLSLFLTIAFVAGFMVAQGQQLKTFHSFCPGGKEYSPNDLSYTGYEDELGNITKHGLWTANLSNGKYSINFKQGKLDGNGTITSSKTTCNLKYVADKLISINYVEKGTESELFIFKYSLDDNGLLNGDFEFKQISSYDNSLMKGKFDAEGKATGWWEVKLREDKEVSKKYYEHGYCLGGDEKTIELSRAYLIDKKMSEIELRNMGYFVINDMPDIKRKLEVAISAAQNYLYYKIDFNNGQCMSLKIKNVFNFDNIFNYTYLSGSPITYMSSELYQNVVNQIKNNSFQDNMTPKYDKNLHKYYLLKTDGKSRLYIPIESEKEFEELYKKN